jgi:outer membrane protein OmpA-like peptidoglycan-associated protein
LVVSAPLLAARDTTTTGGHIPLCEGLTIVTAIDERNGDYESVKRITTVTPKDLNLTVQGDRPVNSAVRRINVARTVLRDDLRTATFYLHTFDMRAPKLVPGSTAIGTSTAVLAALKAKGAADIAVVDPSARAASPTEMRRNLWMYKVQRVGSVMVPVTVNGTKVDLTAIHARGDYMGDHADFFFLDDPANPLTLKYRFTSGPNDAEPLRLQVVQISYKCDPSTTSAAPPEPSRLERALLEQGRADVYEIYFEFSSARIRDVSASTLQEIADVLKRHPDWTLGIEGHTDSIASDTYNLELSRSRAAAVKEALTTRHGVDAGRLATAGFGESRPKDRNDTLEGRARNRRVELVRQR